MSYKTYTKNPSSLSGLLFIIIVFNFRKRRNNINNDDYIIIFPSDLSGKIERKVICIYGYNEKITNEI